MTSPLQDAEAALLKVALSFPGAVEDFPWNERVVKVNKKIFAFLGILEEETPRLRLSVKLRDSHEEALSLPFTTPSGYNLGKHGWVVSSFTSVDDPPVSLLMDWIEESYRLIAPKKLVAELDQPATPSSL
jgi:predicted DNA-binding protein (MmcQ/YjbR family)